MTTEQIKKHLLACGLTPISSARFNLWPLQVRITDEPDGSVIITFSFYDPQKDTELVFAADMAASHLIENALTDASKP